MPYKNPENQNGIGLSSVCVHYPDDPIYRQALLGALAYFTKWVAWERDDTGKAAISAALWYAAYEKTIENWQVPCDDCEDCDMTDINIQVNVQTDCHYTGENTPFYCVADNGDIYINPSPIDDIYYPPPTDLPPELDDIPVIGDEGTDPPPDGFDTWDEWDLDACAAANAMVEWQYQFWKRIADFFGQDVYTLAAVVVVVVNVVTMGGLSVLYDRRLQLKIVEIVGKLAFLDIIGDYAVEKAFQITDNRQALVCELYSSRKNQQDWANKLTSTLLSYSTAGTYTANEMSTIEELFSYLLPGLSGLWFMYNAAGYEAGGNYVSCESCEDDDWRLATEHSIINTTQSVYSLDSTPTSFTLEGHFVRGTITDLSVVIERTENPDAVTSSRFTFDIDVQHISETEYSVHIGKDGADNYLCNGNTSGSAIVYYGAEPADVGDFDFVIPLTDPLERQARFYFKRFTYDPKPVDVLMVVSNMVGL